MSTEVDDAKLVAKEFLCDCEVCAHTAAICPASASSLILEVAHLRRFKAAALTLTTEASVRFVMEKLDAKK